MGGARRRVRARLCACSRRSYVVDRARRQSRARAVIAPDYPRPIRVARTRRTLAVIAPVVCLARAQ